MFVFSRKADVKDKTAKCLACHEDRVTLHSGTSRHKSAGVSCDDCHSIHGGRGKNLKADQSDLL
jgi:hypothetical protein